MKILVVATWYPHDENPTEAPFNAEHVEAIRGRGHDARARDHRDRVVHVRLGSTLGMPKQRTGLWEGTPVRRIPADPKRPFTLVQAARTLAREMAWADVVHTMAFSSILVTLLPWAARTLAGRGRAFAGHRSPALGRARR